MPTIDYKTLTTGLDRDYDILCLDTEFTRLPFSKEAIWIWAEQAQILSIALAPLNVSSPPTQLHVTRVIDAETRRRCSPFVLSDVLPQMMAAPVDSTARKDQDFAVAMRNFIQKRQDLTGLPTLLAVDWIGDAYLVNRILGQHSDWLLLDSVPEIEYALGDGFPPGSSRHNALHDAHAICHGLRRWLDRQYASARPDSSC